MTQLEITFPPLAVKADAQPLPPSSPPSEKMENSEGGRKRNPKIEEGRKIAKKIREISESAWLEWKKARKKQVKREGWHRRKSPNTRPYRTVPQPITLDWIK